MVNTQKNPLHTTKKWLRISFLAALIFFIDQVTKLLVRTRTPFTDNGILDVTLTTNTGSLFGLFTTFGNSNLVFILLSIIAIPLLVLAFRDEQNPRLHLPLGLVIGGILGNFLDRVYFGAVIDWLRVPHWPVFNLADTALVIGVVLLLYHTLRDELRKNNAPHTRTTTGKKAHAGKKARAKKQRI